MVQGAGPYLLQILVMLAFSGLLYGWLLSGRYANVQIMLLVGIIVEIVGGTFFLIPLLRKGRL